MCEKLEQDTEVLEDREKVLVPVRRHKVDKQAEQEIQEEPRPVKQRETPRRWYVY